MQFSTSHVVLTSANSATRLNETFTVLMLQKSHLVISSRWIKVNLHAMLQSLKPFFLQITSKSE